MQNGMSKKNGADANNLNRADAPVINGADAIVESLKREGVGVVFGYPGASVLPLYEALRSSGIRHVLTRTEQGAGHAASGYARMSGRPGVCVATSGPGATNLFTAIATAYSDSIPMIAVTGQAATYNLGRDVFQEIDATGAAEPFTKYTYLVKSAADIGRVFKEAFHICSTGRKGPVLIDMPVDVQQARAKFDYPDIVDIRGYKPRFSGNAPQVKRVAEAICSARRPLLCLGGGVFLSGAKKEAHDFCERANLPVVTTLMGVGAMPRTHPLYCGMVGQSGGEAANYALSRADVLILIGARVGDRAINKPADLSGTIVVHIDIDSAEIGKNMGTTVPLVGDAARVLGQLSEREITGDWRQWLEELDGVRQREQEKYDARKSGRRINDNQSAGSGPSCVDPVVFVRELSALLPDDSIYVADVGQNQIWSAKNFTSNGRFMTTGGMGTMGYSLPAAIGAQIACPGKTVLAVAGDGAFQMSMNELATVKKENLPIKIILMNNGSLGLVRELQVKEYAREFATDVAGWPDYGAIAAAYNIPYKRACNTEQAVRYAREALGGEGARILECAIDPEEPSA